MKEYVIKVNVENSFIDEITNKLVWAYEDNRTQDKSEEIIFYLDAIENLKKWRNREAIYIKTLKQYFDLLRDISYYTEGHYEIHDDGQTIEIKED